MFSCLTCFEEWLRETALCLIFTPEEDKNTWDYYFSRIITLWKIKDTFIWNTLKACEWLTYICLQGGATKPTCNSQAKPKSSRRGSKDAGDKGNIQNPQQDSPSSPSLLHRTAGGLRFPKPARPPESSLTIQMGNMLSNPGGNVNVKRSEAPFFYKPGRPALSLFRQPKTPTAEDCSSRLTRRRGSEPEQRIADQASALSRTRLPSDPGLKPSHADQHARFCLSPCATKAVRDYFSSHPLSNPQSSQEVALAQQEWLKRCSDATAEPDLEQLLFAEESYVWNSVTASIVYYSFK